MDLLLTIFFYPGIVLALALGVLLAWLIEGRLPIERPRIAAFWSNADGMAGTASLLLAGLALALLPWPIHPAAGRAIIANPMLLWAALEGAFLVPLLPGLLAPATLAARAASREAQISMAGRFVLWLVIGIALWAGTGWSRVELPARLIAFIAGLLVLPVAAGIGPFGPERSLSAAGAEEGLDPATTSLLRFIRWVRAAVLTAALVVSALPVPQEPPLIQPMIAMVIALALFVVIGLVLRRVLFSLPRITLPAALHWCWWRALPLAAAALVYSIIV